MRKEEARETLEQADVIGRRIHDRGRWYLLFSALFATLTFTLTVVIGLFPSQTTILVSMAAYAVLLTALLVFALRQPVVPRGYGMLHCMAMLGWGTVYAVTLFVGFQFFPQDPVWWVSGAALGTVPPLVAGWLAARRVGGGV